MSDNELKEKIKEWANIYIDPAFVFRKYQLETIVSIIQKITNSDGLGTTQILNAPTGSGKSLIAIISAGVLWKYFKYTSYILCSDLFLFDQYSKFISEHQHINELFGQVKGQHGNYICLQNGQDIRNSECRIGKVSWQSLYNAKSAHKIGYDCASKCEYVCARHKAIKAPVTLMTYQLFLYQLQKHSLENLNGKDNKGKLEFTPRNVVFCDECHNMPGIIQGKFSPVISSKTFEKLCDIYEIAYKKKHAIEFLCDEFNFDSGNESDDESTDNILNAYKSAKYLRAELYSLFRKLINPRNSAEEDYDIVSKYEDILNLFKNTVEYSEDKIAQYKSAHNNKPISKEALDVYKLSSWFHNYMDYFNDFIDCIKNTGPQYLIKEVNIDNRDKSQSVTLSCAKEDYMISEHILKKSVHHVMMSATIGDKYSFDDNIGMKYMNNESTMDIIPSTFDFSKSPIYFIPRYKLNYRDKEKNFPYIKKMIYDIVAKFKGMHGIIQTGSYSNAKEIYDTAPYNIRERLLLYNDSREKDALINIYKFKDDAILIGPTLIEGIDFPDDLCRFLIISKVPFPSLGSKLVCKKNELFPRWYDSTASSLIIQGIGRGNRHEKDWCITYIIDGSFQHLYYKTKSQYPQEIQERIITIK